MEFIQGIYNSVKLMKTHMKRFISLYFLSDSILFIEVRRLSDLTQKYYEIGRNIKLL